MGALLKAFFGGIGAKDYVYGALILAALVGAGWYTVHERNIGAAKIIAKDAKLAAAVEQHNKDVEKIAALEVTKLGVKLDETLSTPVTDAPDVRLCHFVASYAHQLPRASVGTGPAAADPAAGGGPVGAGDAPHLEAGPPVGAPLVTVSRDDDATIKYLLGYIDALEAEMRKANGR
jgi:hypothetical protein